MAGPTVSSGRWDGRRTRVGALALVVAAAACIDPLVPQGGCDGPPYPEPATSPYLLPYPASESHRTGLSNCSASFHAAGTPDQYAYDFDMPAGSDFLAARAGLVVRVVEDQNSFGGGSGNYLLVDHEDGTHAYYLHSPENGIHVEEGDRVEVGQPLGVIGQSGLAGYPHLHFIVVTGDPAWPYQGVPVSFRNADPAHRVLESYAWYRAVP